MSLEPFPAQRLRNIRGDLRRDWRQIADTFALADRQRHTVTIEQAIAAGRADAFAAGHDAGQIERVGGTDRDECAVRAPAAHFTQTLYRARQRELLARHAGD